MGRHRKCIQLWWGKHERKRQLARTRRVWKDNTKCILISEKWCGVDSCGSGLSPVACSWEHGSETSVFVRSRDLLSNWATVSSVRRTLVHGCDHTRTSSLLSQEFVIRFHCFRYTNTINVRSYLIAMLTCFTYVDIGNQYTLGTSGAARSQELLIQTDELEWNWTVQMSGYCDLKRW
jgi:hypothetical protein